jgi:hypothetical protein
MRKGVPQFNAGSAEYQDKTHCLRRAPEINR